MTNLTILNAPQSFSKKFGTKIDFSKIVGIYWDGMDWCQYNEIIADEKDLEAYNSLEKNISKTNSKEFLEDENTRNKLGNNQIFKKLNNSLEKKLL